LFHIIEVERGNGITAFDGFGKHIASIDESEFFVADHEMSPVEALKGQIRPG
jgi:hypothetical protein